MSSTSSNTPSSRQARREEARKKKKGSSPAGTTAGSSSSDVSKLLLANPFVSSARINSQRFLEPEWTEFTGASEDSILGREDALKGDELVAALTAHLSNRPMDPSVPSSMKDIVTDASTRASVWVLGEIKGLMTFEELSLSPKEKAQLCTMASSLNALYPDAGTTFCADIPVDVELIADAEEILRKESATASDSEAGKSSFAPDDSEQEYLGCLLRKVEVAETLSPEDQALLLVDSFQAMTIELQNLRHAVKDLNERSDEASQADATNVWDLMADFGNGLSARAHQLRRSLFVLRERRAPTLDEYRSMMPTSLQEAYDKDVLGKK